MKEICPHDKCTGCRSCANACAHKAITFRPDALGFMYPVIDSARCIDCGLCVKSCPANDVPTRVFPDKCYAAALSDKASLLKSSSGGAAYALSLAVINAGGVVYGCSGAEASHVRHIRVTTPGELQLLRGSKYVQSDTGFIFRDVREDLKSGLEVLFVGTPCQVAGLLRFLRRDYEKLTTVDLVCHGVPSQQLLNDAIAELQTKYPDMDVNSLQFRGKSADAKGRNHSWFGISFQSAGETVRMEETKDFYFFGFKTALFYRDSCYVCDYSYSSRVSDLTVCDFWGLGKSKMNHGEGVSCILINTDRGAKLLERSSGLMTLEERTVREAVCGNGNLMRPSAKNPGTGVFRALYPQKGWSESVKKSLKHSFRKHKLIKLVSLIKKLI